MLMAGLGVFGMGLLVRGGGLAWCLADEAGELALSEKCFSSMQFAAVEKAAKTREKTVETQKA